MRSPRARPILLLLALAACRGEPPGASHELPLLDGAHAPDVLTESRRLEPPPATAGNRFVKGWNFRRREGALWLYPRAGARLEAVQLAARPRELVLRTEISDPPAGAEVRVWADHREVGSFPLVSPPGGRGGYLQIPLPADLPLGRFAIDLEFSPGVEVAVDQAGFRRALTAGEVELGDGAIVQSGDSLVDVVRRVPEGTVLAGRFVPPAGAGSDQRFRLLVEGPGGLKTVFEWPGGWWQRLGGERDFAAALPAGGLVRVRFLARGAGPTGRWQDLRLRLPEPPSRETPAAVPEAPRLVLLYVMDALRADYLGHLGGPEGVSPHLDRLAAEGVTFTRHLSVAPNTLPSTKSLFTGQAYLARGARKLPSDGPETLAEVFQRAGFRTAVFCENPNVSAAYGTVRGFEHDARREIDRHAGPPASDYNDSAERVQAAALRWLDGLAAGEPAFAYVHSLNPHNPYQPPEPFRGRFAGDPLTGNRPPIDGSTETLLAIKKGRPIDAADEERIRGLYAGGVAYNDLHLQRLRDEIERRYAPGEALVIVTSDHGDELFEHGGVLHGYTLYEDQLRIPLIFWWPTRIEPRRVTAATDNLDLHETLRRLVAAPPSDLGEGQSLWPLLLHPLARPGKEVRFAAASSLKGGIFMARSERYKLIWAPRTGAGWGQGEGRGRSRDPEYLFDLLNDPGETVNLAGDGSLEAAWLRSRLGAWIERGKAIEAGAEEEEVELDAATRDQLKALGYLD